MISGDIPKITAIVPAFNEEQTVEGVVRTLKRSPLIHDVIVVSDGSIDNTAHYASAAGADLVLTNRYRLGKGGAILIGLKYTDAPILAFFDADLIGLTQEHIRAVILPVLNGSKDMNIGLRARRFVRPLQPYIFKIAGQRALKREIITNIPEKNLSGYKIETALNYEAKAKKYRQGHSFLYNLEVRKRFEKVGLVKGFIGYVTLSIEILYAHVILLNEKAKRGYGRITSLRPAKKRKIATM